jgi:hypothetical protein
MQACKNTPPKDFTATVNDAAITHNLRSNDDATTETEDAAMAADAIQGLSDSPHGTKIPDNHKEQGCNYTNIDI